MKRVTALLLAVTILTAGASLTTAKSIPIIAVSISGIELCTQSVCGAANFAGVIRGRVGNRNMATGNFQVAINHDPLPAPHAESDITGGSWSLSSGQQLFSGTVADGTLFNNGDNTFTVDAVMVLKKGGTGQLHYHGTLNHNNVIPTVTGTLGQ